MIYTASYFEPENHHGTVKSISRSIPKNLKYEVVIDSPLRKWLAPSYDLLQFWKTSNHNEQGYTIAYRRELVPYVSNIIEYVKNVEPQKDETWLCYEKQGEFCHRNLAIMFVEKYRPEIYGGKDVTK